MTTETNGIDEILQQTDDLGETSAPDDDNDTAGPDADDEEVAGAELEAEEGDTGDIKALHRRGKHKITLQEAKTLQARARKRGQAVGQKKAAAKPAAAIRLPKNMVAPNSGITQLVEKWTRKGEPFIMRQEGHYYAVTEVRCIVEGTPQRAWVRIPAGTYKFFEQSVGDDSSLLGNPAKVTTNLTNLQRPSKNTYNEQDFLIRNITMQEAGLRVRYDQAVVDKIGGASAQVLSGRAWLWDDAKLFLPGEIFHDFTGENLLYRALRRSGVLFFNWDKRRVGGNGTVRQVLIDHLRNVPDTKVKSLARTSGGAPVLPMPDGYIFTDNPERSEEGAFSAMIQLHEDIAFPVSCIDIGEGMATKPLEIGLYIQLSLNGVSFENAKRQTPSAA